MKHLNQAAIDAEQREEAKDLERGLSNRHIQLIAIGGAIGVGLFLGSAKAIAKAGSASCWCTARWRAPSPPMPRNTSAPGPAS